MINKRIIISSFNRAKWLLWGTIYPDLIKWNTCLSVTQQFHSLEKITLAPLPIARLHTGAMSIMERLGKNSKSIHRMDILSSIWIPTVTCNNMNVSCKQLLTKNTSCRNHCMIPLNKIENKAKLAKVRILLVSFWGEGKVCDWELLGIWQCSIFSHEW